MHPTDSPITSNQALAFLVEVFSGFKDEWEEEENPYIREDGSFSLHSVWMVFTDFFGHHKDSVTADQALALANFINHGLGIDPNFENAVSTCFLEHLHQIGGTKTLKHYLGPQAREQLRR